MPPYWRRYQRRQRPWRRRRYSQYWRIRRAIQRRLRRRRYWVRRKRLFFTKYKRKRKLSKKRLIQWQPETINKCIIKGQKCIFEGGTQRLSNNFYEYFGSYVPVGQYGGGGWSLMVFSLDSLWEDFELLQNVWSKSNAGLPLVTYQGASLKFYQSSTTDYVVKIERCWPMVDTPLTHANTHPQRLLLDRKSIKIPSLQTKRRKKPYKRVWVKPPSQLQNQWYFQKDIAATKLLMIASSACSLTDTYISPSAKSNNITLYCLNVNFFQNRRFQNPSTTTGYFPKANTYMYANIGGTTTPTSINHIIYLGNTKDYQEGKPYTQDSKPGDLKDWGNPFWHRYIHNEYQLYTSTTAPHSLTTSNLNTLSKMTEPYFIEVRYNPDKDKGYGNEAYFLDNSSGEFWNPPTQPDRKIDGFPLWIMLWGWPDWIKKLAAIPHIDDNWLLTIKTDYFSQKLPAYVVIDWAFWNNKGPYDTDPTYTDLIHWHPKFKFQQQSVEQICETGPSVTRTTEAVQAKMTYKFHFKWGGCPRQLEKVYDPSQQQTWPTPHMQLPGFQIQNPAASPETYFYPWDVRKDFITKKAIQRVTDFKETDESLLSLTTGCKTNPRPYKTHQEEDQTSSDEEKEKTSLQQQLRNVRHQQRQLKRQLLRLITPNLE